MAGINSPITKRVLDPPPVLALILPAVTENHDLIKSAFICIASILPPIRRDSEDKEDERYFEDGDGEEEQEGKSIAFSKQIYSRQKRTYEYQETTLLTGQLAKNVEYFLLSPCFSSFFLDNDTNDSLTALPPQSSLSSAPAPIDNSESSRHHPRPLYVFHDLAVRLSGVYRLQFSLIHMIRYLLLCYRDVEIL